MMRIAIAVVCVLLAGCRTALPATPTPQPQPQPTPSLIGVERRLGESPTGSWSLWVQRVAYDIAERALIERDDRSLASLVATYEIVTAPNGARIVIRAIDGTAAHVELLDGPQAGRRGWLHLSQLTP